MERGIEGFTIRYGQKQERWPDGHENEWKSATDVGQIGGISMKRQRLGIREVMKLAGSHPKSGEAPGPRRAQGPGPGVPAAQTDGCCTASCLQGPQRQVRACQGAPRPLLHLLPGLFSPTRSCWSAFKATCVPMAQVSVFSLAPLNDGVLVT